MGSRMAPTAPWAGAGIPLNAVAPGVVTTPMTAPLLDDPTWHEIVDDAVPMPLGGYAGPDEIAAVLDWLTGPDNTKVTGQVIFVDGGADAVLRQRRHLGDVSARATHRTASARRERRRLAAGLVRRSSAVIETAHSPSDVDRVIAEPLVEAGDETHLDGHRDGRAACRQLHGQLHVQVVELVVALAERIGGGAVTIRVRAAAACHISAPMRPI